MHSQTLWNPPADGSSEAPSRRVGTRLRGAAAAASVLGLWALLASLTPSASGAGTHRQLGLPACGLLARTGWPCPTCGVTTSLSNLAHGHVGQAWADQPFGVFLGALAAAVFAAGLADACCGSRLLARLRPTAWRLLAVAAVLLACWAWVLVAGARSGRWPLH